MGGKGEGDGDGRKIKWSSWLASWEQSLACVQTADLDHVSVYMLEVDEDSRLGREVLLGGQRFHAGHVVSDTLTASLYERACEVLPQAGFAQYEISNFALPGRECPSESQRSCVVARAHRSWR